MNHPPSALRVGVLPVVIAAVLLIFQQPAAVCAADHGATTERFQNSTVRLVNRSSGLVLAVAGNSKENNAAIIQESYTHSRSQHWTFRPAENGFVLIVNENSGKCLGIPDASKEKGKQAIQYQFNPKAMDHYWTIEDAGDGFWKIVNRASGMCLGIPGASKMQGKHAIQYPFNRKALDHYWRIELVPPAAEQLISRLNPQHPRLLVNAAGFDALRHQLQTDSRLQEWDRAIRRDADNILLAPLPKYVFGKRKNLLPISRHVMSDCYTLALMYRLHEDRRYADRLWQEMESVAAFPDFNPEHFLDTAEMTNGLAIAYDWLYDTWTDSQRVTIRKAIVQHGLRPGIENYKSGKDWPNAVHNRNLVCNGGLTMGALAVGDVAPKASGEVLHRALSSVQVGMRGYAPDGAWDEGPIYWNYGFKYNVLMLASLRSALGTDFGLSETSGFADTGLFPIYMTGPTRRTFNFADCNNDRWWSLLDCLFWSAKSFDRPVYTWFARNMDRPTVCGMLWCHDPGEDPIAASLPLDRYWRKAEIVTMRGSWNDERTIFVGIKAGSNEVGHGHLDLGSFVFDALGQRWAVDLGGDEYSLPEYFDNEHYPCYRRRAEGHNTLVIHPDKKPDQDPHATAKISHFDSRPEKVVAVANLTPAYGTVASHVHRGIAMLNRRYVLVQDELITSNNEVYWFVHTPASITFSSDGRSATLVQKGEKVLVRLLVPANARFEDRPATPLPSSPHPKGQAENNGVHKLTIHLSNVNHQRIAVLFVPLDQKTDPGWTPTVTPLATW